MVSIRSEEKNRFKIQILISILTLVLTPLLAGVVVYYQLEKQHDIWNTQRNLIREERLFQEKIDRIDYTGKIISSLIQKARTGQTVINTLVKVHGFPDIYSKRVLDEISPTILEMALEYEDLEAELLNTIMVNGLYFGGAVKKIGDKLVSSIHLLRGSVGSIEKVKLLKEEYFKLEGSSSTTAAFFL